MSDKRIHIVVRNEEGVVLAISMVMLVLLSLLGVLSVSLSATNIQSASYQKLSTQSFSGAESGLTQSRSDMQTFVLAAPQNGQWPALDSTVMTGAMGGAGPKSYNLTIQGKPVTFNFSIADFGAVGDRTVMVTSTGTFQNVQQRVEAVVRYEPPSDPTGAQECYSSTCTSVDQNSGGTVTNRLNSTAAL